MSENLSMHKKVGCCFEENLPSGCLIDLGSPENETCLALPNNKESLIKRLNVGCGVDDWGDVRLDSGRLYITRQNMPTIIADAQFLPFIDKCFEITKANHLLEHLPNPSKGLSEIERVTINEIKLAFPTELDIWPYVLSVIFPIPIFRSIYTSLETRRKRLHHWIINPVFVIDFLSTHGWKSHCIKNNQCILTQIESGRKSRLFKTVSETFRIPFEYLVVSAHPKERFTKQQRQRTNSFQAF